MSFNIDKKLTQTESGSWGSFQGSEFLIAHISCLGFQRTLARLQQPYRKKIEQGTMDPAVSKELLCKAMASDLILDWKGVTNGEGQEVPFTEENAVKALLNAPDFREFVAEFAQNLENFRAEEMEATGKS